MTNLYGGTILRVDLSEGTISKEPVYPYTNDFLGGRGINIKLLYDEFNPGSDPLSPANPLIFGVGPLCGTPVPASRTEVTSKSPETGLLGSANFGGFFGPELKFAGYDHIFITGKADKPVYLQIHNDSVEIRDASYIWGKDTYATQEILRSEIDPEFKIACIGQAGENLVRFATVQHELRHGAGRTGIGCVMGSKNLKAVAVRGTKGITLADPKKYLSLVEKVQMEVKDSPQNKEFRERGMSFEQDDWWVQLHYQPDWEPKIHQYDLYHKYLPKKVGCFGCPAQCMDLYPVKAMGGGAINCSFYAGAIYELRNNDLDLLLESGLYALRYGIDINSFVGIMRWLMILYEKGIITAKDTDGIPMKWGSREAIMGMLKKVALREDFGNVIADGILPAAKRIGKHSIEYADHIRGLTQYSPRMRDNLKPLKGFALAMAVSSRGDTMRTFDAGQIFEEQVKIIEARSGKQKAHEYEEGMLKRAKEITGTEKAARGDEYEGKAEYVAYMQDVIAINDCLSACKFHTTYQAGDFSEKHQAELFSAGTGIETDKDTLFKFAKRVNNLERAFNVREGVTRETDSLPKGYMDQPVERGIFRGKLLKSDKFEDMKSRYYIIRGWDIKTGIPTKETLEESGLSDVARDLGKMGKIS